MRTNDNINEVCREMGPKLKLEFVEKNGEKKWIYCTGDKKIEIADENMIKRMKAIEEEMQREFIERVSDVIKGIENS